MNNVINSTLKYNYCIGCGICANVCPKGCIKIVYNEYKEYIPIIDKEKCINCGECVKYCTNSNDRKKEEVETLASKADKNFFGLEGSECFVCKDKNLENVMKSASGGFTTAFAIELIKKNLIDFVIHAGRIGGTKGEPHFEAKVSSTIDELNENRSSIYGPVCFNEVIEKFKNKSKRILIIGTPCVIRGVKKLFNKNKLFCKNKIYTISLICSHNVNGQFVDFLAESYSLKEDERYFVNLRAKDKEMKNHNEFLINFYNENKDLVKENRFKSIFTKIWRGYYFAMNTCNCCGDFWGREADISTKDSWGDFGKDDRYGGNIVIVRNKNLLEIINNMDSIVKTSISVNEIAKCQIATSRYKQVELEDRINNIKNNVEQQKLELSKELYLKYGYKVCRNKMLKKELNKDKVMKLIKKIKILISKVVNFGIGKFLIRWLKKIVRIFRYKKKTYKKIVMFGGFGGINAGDEAQIDETYSILRKRYPDYLVKILSHVMHNTYFNHYECLVGENSRTAIFDLDENGDYYSINKLSNKIAFLIKGWITYANAYLVRAGLPTVFINAKKASFLQEIKTSDLVYISGGGYLTGDTLSRLWDHLFVIKIATVLKVPCVLSGHNIGLWNSSFTKKFATNNFKKAKVITTRDPEDSIKALNEIGVAGDNVFVMFDDALFCKKNDDIDSYLNNIGIKKDKKYIAFHLHYWGIEDDIEAQKELLSKLNKISQYMLNKTSYDIVLSPIAAPDAKPMKEFYEKYGHNERIHLLQYNNYDFKVIRGILSKAEYCITMKHHPIIFSIGEEVPTISIAYKPYYVHKNVGALKLFGLEQYSLDIEKSNYYEEFINKFDSMIENRDEIKMHIRKKLVDLKETREKFLKMVDDCISK